MFGMHYALSPQHSTPPMPTAFHNRILSHISPSETSSFGWNRRQLLGTFSLAGLGLLATSASASAFRAPAVLPKVTVHSALQSQRGLDYSDLPADWVRLQGSNLTAYGRYLSALNLKRLTPLQVIEAHAKKRGSVWNSLPPRTWWKRMAKTLQVVDRIAIELRSPVEEIVSAYRSPSYNARCPGAARGSWHQANVAVDVKFPMRASAVTAASRKLRDRGLFKGGVGGYSSFTHIDTRGTNTDW